MTVLPNDREQRIADARLMIAHAKATIDGKAPLWHYSETALVRALELALVTVADLLKENGIVL